MMKTGLTKKHIELLEHYGLSESEINTPYVLNYQRGEYVFQEGYPITWLGIVVRGKAKVCCSSPNGNHLVLCYFISSGIIGGIEMMANTPNATASLLTLTEFECIVIPFDSNIPRLKKNPVFLDYLCSQLSLNLVKSSSNFVSSALYTGKQRLCTYIIEANHDGLFNETLTDVASLIGLSYRQLFRILGELCDEKILIKKESGYIVNNKKQLKAVAIQSANVVI